MSDGISDGLEDALPPREELPPETQEAMDRALEISRGAQTGDKPKFDPKAKHPMQGFEGGDDDSEFGEPDQGTHDSNEDGALTGVKPMIASLVFTGTDKGGDFEQVVQTIIGIAERSGLFYLSAFVNELDSEHIVPGSPLHQELTGRST